jgi:putative endonuclease
MKAPTVYILASKQNGTLYIGVTSDIIRRIHEHKTHAVRGFTDKYNVTMLVYYEQHLTMDDAILREKQLKKWKRVWKLELIEKDNPNWDDLYEEII